MRAVLFANGELEAPPHLDDDDLIIAADGGARHCLALGIRPAYVVGDLDSLNQDDIDALTAAGARMVRYPQRKDFTDLELALQQIEGLQVDEVLIYGALGIRWDQTVANLMLAGSYAGAPIRLAADHQEILFLHGGESIKIHGAPWDTVSLIPLSGKAAGITTSHLEYPLKDDDLVFGSTRGVSNVLLKAHAEVTLKEGLLAIILIHQTGSPHQEEDHEN